MNRVLLCLLLFAVPCCAPAKAEVSSESDFFTFERASQEEILNIKTSVASRTSMKLRETPGLVTVMTEEDIRLSGARDLVDLLRLVPDFEFSVDVQGNLGLGVKGNSGNEGKVLLLWDGQPYNELMYSTVQYDRFPVDQIEKIEIIRGPGSVIYGGVGELAVINIMTKTTRSLNGGRLYGGYGQMRGARGRSFAGYQFGGVYGDTKFSALAHVSSAQRSDRTYRDFAGGSYDMNGDSDLRSKNLNLFLKRKGLSLRFIADDYSQLERDHFTTLLATGATSIKFPVYSFEVKDCFQAAENLKLESKFSYQYSTPWKELDEHFPYDKTVRKDIAGVTAFYEPAGKASLIGGAEFTHDEVDVGARTGASSSSGTLTGAQYDNLAFFAQATLNLDIFNVIAGGRFDRHSHSGASFVPRLAVTKLVNDFNFKAIYSGAFRAPSIENIRLNPAIEPEHTTTAEFEAGYKVNEALFMSANAFDITINDPIVFFYNGTGENYVNFPKTGTRGYGFDLKYKKNGDYLELGYSAYTADKNRVEQYKNLKDSAAMLAFPRYKAVLNARYQFSKRLTASPTVIYLSQRYAYNAAGETKAYGAVTLGNVYFS
ncbi:MAG: TonB-dependent receptor plug domain-containing protein, partial [Elusimicrobia bacterium]|nr:TonB-dependent receptor plug domain-containing protein [Elusimicrobiota bacterium]